MKSITFILFLLFPLFGLAQHPYAINYTDRDGLPTNELFWVVQGKRGDIWLGTDLGLVRYDGQRFQRYLNTQVQNKAISAIYEDAQGTLWCSNFANQVFYLENDSLHLFEEWEKVKKPGFNYQNFTNGADANELIIQYDVGLARCYNKDSIVLFEEANFRSYAQITPKGYYTFGSHQGFKYTSTSGKSSFIACPSCFYFDEDWKTDKKVKTFTPLTLTQHKDKVYGLVNYYALNKGVYINQKGQSSKNPSIQFPFLFELRDDSMRPIYFPEKMRPYERSLIITNHHFETEQILWLATNIGAFRWNIVSGKLQHFFQNQYISDVIYDREGSIWCTSLTNGLYFVPDLRIQTLNGQVNNTRPTALEITPQGKMMIGYGDGKVELLHTEVHSKKHPILKLASSQIESITFDTLKQQFWVGNISTHILDTLLRNQSTYENINSSKKIEFDTRGNVFLFRGHTLSIINRPNTDSLQLPAQWKNQYGPVYEKQPLFHEIRPRGCCHKCYTGLVQEKPQYQVWAGFYDDLYLFKDTGFIIIKDAEGQSIVATDLVETADGSIWAGTFSQGLLKIKNEQVVQQISLAEGLPDIYITKIVVDQHILWLATPRGIVRYNTNNQNIVVYDEYYGVPYIKINDMTLLNHRLYFTGNQQVFSFDTRINPSEVAAPIIRLDHWWVNDQQMNGIESSTLEAQENSISIQLSAISFRSRGKYQFKYRLQGLEEDWIFVSSNNNVVRYSSLPPGDYRFEAYIVNKWEAESPEPVILEFSILPAFYQTWWFIVLSILTALILISLVFWWQLQRIQKRNREKLERSQLESQLRISQLKALKAQMNPHFIFNALNSIQGLYAQDDQLKANTQLSKFSQLVRRTLDLSNETYIPLEAELEILELYLEIEQTRFMGELEYDFLPPENIDTEEILVPSLLIQPYVENAVKHGLLHKDGEKKVLVKMEFLKTEQILKVTIDDNGIGREASQEINQQRKKHKSFATSANSTRLALLNEERKNKGLIGVEFIDKKDNKGQALGTTVIINIPINYERNLSR